MKRLLIATLLLTGCSDSENSNSTAGNDAAAAAEEAESSADVQPELTESQPDGWQTASETDPMTDQIVHRASGNVSNFAITAQTEIKCGSDRMTYVMTIFDSAGQPAEMEVRYGRIPAKLRIDDQPPFNLSRGAQVTNRLDFFALEPNLANASKLTVRLNMLTGEQTLVIDQTDPTLRAMLNQCASTLGQQRAAEKASRDRAAAEQYARCGDHPCPIEFPVTPVRELGGPQVSVKDE